MAIFLACFLSFSAAVGRKCQPSLQDIVCGPRRKKTHQSPRRPDERHPTFPILFNTNDFSLGTSVSLNIFDDLSIGATFSVLDHLIASCLWLCYNDLAVVMVLLSFTFETESTGFGFQGADFGVNITTVFTTAFG
jgi:hypothetical protein